MSCFRSLSKWPSAFKASMASLVKTSRYSLCKFPRISSIHHLAVTIPEIATKGTEGTKRRGLTVWPFLFVPSVPFVAISLRGFGDIFQRPSGLLLFDFRDIADRHDTDEAFVLIEEKHTANSFVPHLLCDILSIVAFGTPMDILRHHVARFYRCDIAAARDPTDDDVPVGDGAGNAIVFADGQEADI